MTEKVTRHYETLLASNYTWMFGVSLAEKVAEQRDLLAQLLRNLPAHRGLAIDLGSGLGFQSLALADLGLAPVIALDTSATLLAELNANRGNREVVTICADLCDVAQYAHPGDAKVVVCMGDTLTHLPNQDTVRRLFADVFNVLEKGGLFALTFSDLSLEATDLDRFIPIRSDAERIMTCFLEFSAETVTVHDLIHVRARDGWQVSSSAAVIPIHPP